MEIFKSLLLGHPGSFHVSDIKVDFVANNDPVYAFDQNSRNPFIRIVSQSAHACLNSRFFRYFTMGYVHTFVHEMGHALAYKLLTGSPSSIEIQTNTCTGVTHYRNYKPLSPLAESFTSLSGALANIVFSICKIVAACALSSYITVPVALGIGIGAAIWITGELFYAFHSGLYQDHGDFGKIAQNGPLHFISSVAVLTSAVALGIFTTVLIN